MPCNCSRVLSFLRATNFRQRQFDIPRRHFRERGLRKHPFRQPLSRLWQGVLQISWLSDFYHSMTLGGPVDIIYAQKTLYNFESAVNERCRTSLLRSWWRYPLHAVISCAGRVYLPRIRRTDETSHSGQRSIRDSSLPLAKRGRRRREHSRTIRGQRCWDPMGPSLNMIC